MEIIIKRMAEKIGLNVLSFLEISNYFLFDSILYSLYLGLFLTAFIFPIVVTIIVLILNLIAFAYDSLGIIQF